MPPRSPSPSPFRAACRRGVGALALALAAVCAAPGSAVAGLHMGELNRATIVSVEGPRDFTIRREHRRYRIRLGEINTPRGGTPGREAECGAGLVTAALRRMARPGRRVDVLVSGLKESGRFLGDAIDPAHRDDPWSSFSNTLVDRGLATEGLPQSIDAHVIPIANTLELEFIAVNERPGHPYSDVARARARRGVWGACHGRFHLPGGVRPPAVHPATWQTTADGQTSAIGPLALPTTVPPARVLTFRDVASAFPDLEIVRSYDGLCVGTSGSAALWFQGVPTGQHVGSRHRHPCAVASVRGIASLGAATTSGPAVGDPLTALAAAFPAGRTLSNRFYVELDGSRAAETSKAQPCDASPEGRWRTAATIGHRGRIAGWFTRLTERC